MRPIIDRVLSWFKRGRVERRAPPEQRAFNDAVTRASQTRARLHELTSIDKTVDEIGNPSDG